MLQVVTMRKNESLVKVKVLIASDEANAKRKFNLECRRILNEEMDVFKTNYSDSQEKSYTFEDVKKILNDKGIEAEYGYEKDWKEEVLSVKVGDESVIIRKSQYCMTGLEEEFSLVRNTDVKSIDNFYFSISDELDREFENIKDIMAKDDFSLLVAGKDMDVKDVSIGRTYNINGHIYYGRDKTDNGECFKDSEAFKNKEGVCYIPEKDFEDIEEAVAEGTSYEDLPEGYAYQNFLDICNNQEDIAKLLFDFVDWQHPETLYDEFFNNDELYYCDSCKKVYSINGEPVDICPGCGAVNHNKVNK